MGHEIAVAVIQGVSTILTGGGAALAAWFAVAKPAAEARMRWEAEREEKRRGEVKRALLIRHKLLDEIHWNLGYFSSEDWYNTDNPRFETGIWEKYADETISLNADGVLRGKLEPVWHAYKTAVAYNSLLSGPPDERIEPEWVNERFAAAKEALEAVGDTLPE